MQFKKRIPEPKIMEEQEFDVFQKLSQDNYNRWFIPLADDIQANAPKKVAAVLDVACGPGFLEIELGKRFKKARITGLDSSKYAITLAKKNNRQHKNVSFVHGTALKTPFDSESFDMVVCKDSLHHFSNAKTVLREMLRVLKPGGVLYIQDMRRDLPMYLLKRVTPPKHLLQKLQYYSARASYTPSEVKKLFQSVGIKKSRVSPKKLDTKNAKKYKKKGIDASALKDSFVSRYVAVAVK